MTLRAIVRIPRRRVDGTAELGPKEDSPRACHFWPLTIHDYYFASVVIVCHHSEEGVLLCLVFFYTCAYLGGLCVSMHRRGCAALAKSPQGTANAPAAQGRKTQRTRRRRTQSMKSRPVSIPVLLWCLLALAALQCVNLHKVMAKVDVDGGDDAVTPFIPPPSSCVWHMSTSTDEEATTGSASSGDEAACDWHLDGTDPHDGDVDDSVYKTDFCKRESAPAGPPPRVDVTFLIQLPPTSLASFSDGVMDQATTLLQRMLSAFLKQAWSMQHRIRVSIVVYGYDSEHVKGVHVLQGFTRDALSSATAIANLPAWLQLAHEQMRIRAAEAKEPTAGKTSSEQQQRLSFDGERSRFDGTTTLNALEAVMTGVNQWVYDPASASFRPSVVIPRKGAYHHVIVVTSAAWTNDDVTMKERAAASSDSGNVGKDGAVSSPLAAAESLTAYALEHRGSFALLVGDSTPSFIAAHHGQCDRSYRRMGGFSGPSTLLCLHRLSPSSTTGGHAFSSLQQLALQHGIWARVLHHQNISAAGVRDIGERALVWDMHSVQDTDDLCDPFDAMDATFVVQPDSSLSIIAAKEATSRNANSNSDRRGKDLAADPIGSPMVDKRHFGANAQTGEWEADYLEMRQHNEALSFECDDDAPVLLARGTRTEEVMQPPNKDRLTAANPIEIRTIDADTFFAAEYVESSESPPPIIFRNSTVQRWPGLKWTFDSLRLHFADRSITHLSGVKRGVIPGPFDASHARYHTFFDADRKASMSALRTVNLTMTYDEDVGPDIKVDTLFRHWARQEEEMTAGGAAAAADPSHATSKEKYAYYHFSKVPDSLKYDVRHKKVYTTLTDYARDKQYLWISSAGVHMHTHFDQDHNFFVQLRGKKKFTFFMPEERSSMHVFPRIHPLWHKSRAELHNPDVARFPDYAAHAQATQVIVEPGDVLYIPPYVWHHVQTLTPSISISSLSNYDLVYGVMDSIYGFDHKFDLIASNVGKKFALRLYLDLLLEEIYGRGATHGFIASLIAERYAGLESLFGDVPSYVDFCKVPKAVSPGAKRGDLPVSRDVFGDVSLDVKLLSSTFAKLPLVIRDILMRDYVEELVALTVGAKGTYPFFRYCFQHQKYYVTAAEFPSEHLLWAGRTHEEDRDEREEDEDEEEKHVQVDIYT